MSGLGRVYIACRGHPNVQLLHETTLEATVEDRLTPRGDCIACVEARVRIAGACRGLARGVIVAVNPWLGSYYRVFTGLAGDCAKPIIRRSRTCGNSIVCASTVAATDLREALELFRSPFTRVYILVEYAHSEELARLIPGPTATQPPG